MDFGLSQDQVMLKETVRRYLAERCPTTRVRQIMESESGHDETLRDGLTEIGVAGLVVPAEYDGLGRELLDLALVAEEFGYAATPGPFFNSSLAVVALAEGGSDAQKRRWLPGLGGGELIGTVAIGEPEGEWEPARLKAQVEGGKLSGEKPLVPYAGLADVFIVAARDAQGGGLWLVEKGAPGIEIAPLKGSDMTRRLAAVTFKNTPAEPLPNRDALARTFDAGSILIAADAYGGARRCLEMATSYALTREQFGQVIGAFQAVKHQLANMAADLEPSLALYWYAAHAFDHVRDRCSRHASMVKAHMTDLYDRIVRDSTEIHGGIGFTWEFDLHLWFRRSIFDRSFFGDSALHRARAADLSGW